jgi:predicted nucleic acid-binding protein
MLVDTGPLYALADADSALHEPVRNYVMGTVEVLLVPVTVLPEVDYLVANRLSPHASLTVLQAILREMRVDNVTPADLARSLELMGQYADAALGIVDTSIIAIAERLRITRVLTLDQRHFRFVRPRHCDAFQLLP